MDAAYANGNETQLPRFVLKTNGVKMKVMSFFWVFAGICTHEGLIYVCGGYDGASCLSSMERFDPLTGVWSSCPAMNTRRRYCRIAVIGEIFLLYVCIIFINLVQRLLIFLVGVKILPPTAKVFYLPVSNF